MANLNVASFRPLPHTVYTSSIVSSAHSLIQRLQKTTLPLPTPVPNSFPLLVVPARELLLLPPTVAFDTNDGTSSSIIHNFSHLLPSSPLWDKVKVDYAVVLGWCANSICLSIVKEENFELGFCKAVAAAGVHLFP